MNYYIVPTRYKKIRWKDSSKSFYMVKSYIF